MSDRIIRPAELPSIVGLKRSAVEQEIARGNFPKPIRLTDAEHCAAKGWLLSEIERWMQERAAKRDAT